MDRVVELFVEFLQNRLLLIVLLVCLIVAIISLMKKSKSAKGLETQVSELEVDYNTIKSMPLTFKLNKARSLAKVNELIEKDIKGYVESYEAIQKSITRMDTLFEEAHEELASDQITAVKSSIEDISALIDITLKNVTKLNEKLDSVLEQELKLRAEVTIFKERFSGIKQNINSSNKVFEFSEAIIKEYLSTAENEFNAFDEWMYVSEFDNSKQSLEKIDKALTKLDEVLEGLPDLLPIAKETIPRKISEVSSLYSEATDANLYLENLDVTQVLVSVSEQLSKDLSNLRNGQIEIVKTSLESSSEELDLLKEKLELELSANTELVTLNQELNQSLELIDLELKNTQDLYDDLSSRYSFMKFNDSLQKYIEKNDELNLEFTNLKASHKGKTAVSIMLDEIGVFNKKVLEVKLQIEILKADIQKVLSEEKRANQQLLKLYLIINEISVKINDYQIPSISMDYKSDVDIARQHILNIEALLGEETLNVSLLNSTLSESIDYIYKLYNNVNNIVGMAVMVENAIVFANRYRSTSVEVDSQLSKGEVYYRNGEYTQALTTVLEVIEDLHPDDFESLIRENSNHDL